MLTRVNNLNKLSESTNYGIRVNNWNRMQNAAAWRVFY